MSFTRLATLALVVCALLAPPAARGTVATPDGQPSATAVSAVQPNIIVFYLDDLNPHDGRLWSDPALTPNMYDLFVSGGVHLPNAIGETPLCCPGRGSILTGLHTHNHGVTVNDIRLFNPGEHIGGALRDVGYASHMIGKYFNWTERLTAAEWQAHAAGWTELDVIMSPSGEEGVNLFYDYDLFTKQGQVAYPVTHSTRMVAERSVARLRETTPGTPVFQLLSVYNTHAPNLPLAEFADDPRCDSMPPWNPPNYNEADLSDKPTFVRSFPLQPYLDGWPMVQLCREMLGVDWLVGQVVDELDAQGRLDNTLFVFTADNGMGWGEHRWPKKRLAYTTPVPLYMSWTSRWGEQHRVITEGTTNIDLAPTFCEYAGCTLGPYPGGHTAPDGTSIAPILDEELSTLGRDALLETSFGSRTWSAVRTTTFSPLGRWHLIVQAGGFVELYDLGADPWELSNVAADPANQDVRNQLTVRLGELLQEGRVAPSSERPDGSIAVTAVGTFKGVNIYGTTPKDSQTQKLPYVLKKSVHDFTARATNHGSVPATFTVQATSTGSKRISTRYFVGPTEVTAQIVAGTFSFADVPGGASVELTIRMTVGKAPLDAKRSAVITLGLVGGPVASDVLKAVVVRGTPPPPPPPTTVIDLSPR